MALVEIGQNGILWLTLLKIFRFVLENTTIWKKWENLHEQIIRVPNGKFLKSVKKIWLNVMLLTPMFFS